MIYTQGQIKKAGQVLIGDDEFAKLDAISGPATGVKHNGGSC